MQKCNWHLKLQCSKCSFLLSWPSLVHFIDLLTIQNKHDCEQVCICAVAVFNKVSSFAATLFQNPRPILGCLWKAAKFYVLLLHLHNWCHSSTFSSSIALYCQDHHHTFCSRVPKGTHLCNYKSLGHFKLLPGQKSCHHCPSIVWEVKND